MENRMRKPINDFPQKMLTLELEDKSLSLRKQRLEQSIHQRREQSFQSNPIELNQALFNNSIKSLASPQSVESIIQRLSYLSIVFTSNCSIAPEEYSKFNFVQSLNDLIISHGSNGPVLTEVINLLMNSTNRNDPEIKRLFLPTLSKEDYLVNYLSLLEFALTHRMSLINMLFFFKNLINGCELNQRHLLMSSMQSDRLFQTIKLIIEGMMSNSNQDIDLIHALVSFLSSFSHITRFENIHAKRIFLIRKYLVYVIDNRSVYLNVNNEIVRSALFGISYLALTSIPEELSFFFKSNLMESILSLKTDNLFLQPIIEIIGNIASNEATFVSYLVNLNVVDMLSTSLKKANDTTIKERILWALSNIAAEACFVDVLFEKDVIQQLIALYKANPPFSLVYEIWWTLQNVIDSSSSFQCFRLLQVNIIEEIIESLRTWKEPSLLLIFLDCLKTLFSKGKIFAESNDNIFLNIFNDLSGFELIEKIYALAKQQDLKNEALKLLSYDSPNNEQ